jgi:hypothetical protein
MQGFLLRPVMGGNSLAQPHSAVNHQNYDGVGSHTINDAARNAKQNENHNQRMRRVLTNQKINRDGLMQPAKANGSQLPPLLGITSASGSQAALAGVLVGGVGGLFYSPKTKKERKRALLAVTGVGALLTAAGGLTGAFGDGGFGSDTMWRAFLGSVGAVGGLIVANNLRRFGADVVGSPKRPLRLSELPL